MFARLRDCSGEQIEEKALSTRNLYSVGTDNKMSNMRSIL